MRCEVPRFPDVRKAFGQGPLESVVVLRLIDAPPSDMGIRQWAFNYDQAKKSCSIDVPNLQANFSNFSQQNQSIIFTTFLLLTF